MINKPDGYKSHRTISELAQFVGVSTRTMERLYAKGELPEPDHRTESGMKLWSQEQSAWVLSVRLAKLPSEIKRSRRIN